MGGFCFFLSKRVGKQFRGENNQLVEGESKQKQKVFWEPPCCSSLLAGKQGGQIGRFFANWAIVFT
jgi:hypothetical protein